MTNKKYTIKDIAKLSGVSKGTVDRVLHKRGKVSQKAQEKVERILKEINYQPNPIARNLKINKTYGICVLMPNPYIDSYWLPAHQGIREASKEFMPFGVLVVEHLYHPHRVDDFIEKFEDILKSPPDVLLVAPLFQKEAQLIFEQCKKENMLVAMFNNNIDTLKGDIFIGQDLYQSGKVAASLIEKLAMQKVEIAILHIDVESHMKLKEKGFVDYFSERSSKFKILTKSFDSENSEVLNFQLNNFLDNNREITVFFITNSKAYKLAEVIETKNRKSFIVGYDLLEENVDFLKANKIDFLIHQKPKLQAYLGVSHLAEYFLFGKKLPSQKLLPIDIITSENIQYYID